MTPSSQTSTSRRNNDVGAVPDKGVIPLCVPELRGNEWAYIKECLDTNWVSSAGSYVDRFEAELAERVGAAHGVAVVNGTAALHVALLAAGVEPDDEVLVSDLTFISPANAIRYAGAWPVFIDSEPDYWQMDTHGVFNFIEQHCRRGDDGRLIDIATNRPVTAIVPVHILGHPVDMDPLIDLARKYGLKIIEDATEALGATYKGRAVGTLGDAACLSFNGNKLITTGGGGMIVTDNAELADKARYLSTQAKDDLLEYVHGQVGYNYRLTNIQAALGVAQVESLDDYIAAKKRIADRYEKALADLPGVTVMPQADWAQSVWWLYTILVDPDQAGLTSREMIDRLRAQRIQSRPMWQPMHLSPAHAAWSKADCPVAGRLNAQGVSLPCSVGLTEADQNRVIEAIRAMTAA